MQAENRVLRVDQENDVEIVRVIVKHSHDQFREERQTSNVRLEIASKAHLPAMREELVLVLNEAQQKLRELRETEQARALLAEVEEADDWSDSSVAGQVQSQVSKHDYSSKGSSGGQTPCQTPRKPESRRPPHLNSKTRSLSEVDSNSRISDSEDQLLPGSEIQAGEDESDQSDVQATTVTTRVPNLQGARRKMKRTLLLEPKRRTSLIFLQ